MKSSFAGSGRFQVGMERLLRHHRSWLPGRLALVSHQGALLSDGSTAAQALFRAYPRRLVALFGPEHGFLGQADAGAQTATRRHPDWNIPVYSLYGSHRQPTAEMLHGIDTLVFDLQDLGARCYTYLATLRLVMQAAAAQGIRVVVADRPVPLPGVYDGPLVARDRLDFVAPVPMPMCTGLTPGEAARWIVRDEKLNLDLRVVPVAGWDRRGPRGMDWPEWVPPSPGIRSWESGMTYLATVFSEALPGIDCGRGTSLAFRVVGAPWLQAVAIREDLAAQSLPGVRFHPHRYLAGRQPYQGRELDGLRISVTNPLRFRPVLTAVTLLHVLGKRYGTTRVWCHKGVRHEWFDRLYGDPGLQQSIRAGAPPQDIAERWRPALRRHALECRDLLLY